MTSKKSMGLHWDILIIALFISIGILYYSIATVKIPKVGEYSINIIKTSEQNSLLPSIVEVFMKRLNEQAASKFDEHEVFKIRSYCESSDYKASLIDEAFKYKTFIDSTEKLSKVHEPGIPDTISCFVDADDNLTAFFAKNFMANYNLFRTKDFKEINLDLSNTAYASFVWEKDGKYYNTLKTSNGFGVPINLEKDRKKTQIGKVTMKPDYRLAVDYDFDYNPDGTAKEVCIFSSDCGAKCQDVIAKYSGKDYILKESPCAKYYDCAEADDAKDDFGKDYTCKDSYPNGKDNYLCQGQCLPFCSSDDSTLIADADDSTKCKDTLCSSYMSCRTISPADKCGCLASSYACEGTDCDTLHCERDSNVKTWCKDNCNNYRSCSYGLPESIDPSCTCDSLNVCFGDCYCSPGAWSDSGGCGEIAGDGTDCNWDSVPQSRTYDPTKCHSTDYRCDYRPPIVCPCVPDTPCSVLGCDNTDSCDTYCGDCPPPPAATCGSGSNCGNCGSCSECIGQSDCGWDGSSCMQGTSPCPDGNTEWYWSSCSINKC